MEDSELVSPVALDAADATTCMWMWGQWIDWRAVSLACTAVFIHFTRALTSHAQLVHS